MRFAKPWLEVVAALTVTLALASLLLFGEAGSRAASGVRGQGPAVSVPPLRAGMREEVSLPAAGPSAAYVTALGVWDGAVIAGDDSDAAHWLAAGLLLNQGDYPGARRQLKAVLTTAPWDSTLSLKAQLLLGGTSGGRKLVALAFDDFPFADGTPELLALLGQAKAPATFFAIGHKVREFPDLVALALTEGHSIQNHTYHHTYLSGMPPEQVRAELNLCSQTIHDFTGVTPRFLRAPHARSNQDIYTRARECGLVCIDPIVTNIYDMSASSETIYRRCLQRVNPGAILAMHDGLPATREALPRVISALRRQGYEFVTVDQLLAERSPTSGQETAQAERRARLAGLLNGLGLGWRFASQGVKEQTSEVGSGGYPLAAVTVKTATRGE